MFLGITWGELGILADGELLLAETADSEKGQYGDCNHNNNNDDGHLRGDSPFCSGWSRQDIAPF